VRNKGVLRIFKEERIILHTMKIRMVNWIGHIPRRNWFLKHVIEGEIDGRIRVKGRRGTRSKQLLVELKEKRSYCKLKEDALDRTLWRVRFERGCGLS
jgi:hypothetical protein